MRALTSADKENIAPPGSPDVSFKTTTPDRPQRVSWSQKNTQYPYSDFIKSIPSSGKAQGPARSILKKSLPNIEPMQSLAREVTPEPDDVINDPTYLSSPVITLAASVGADMDFSYADLREAYNLLAARLRFKLDDPKRLVSTVPMFKPLCDNAAAVSAAVVRDLGRCFIDPLSSPPDSSAGISERDVFDSPEQPMSSSPVREAKRRGMNDSEIRHARDLYSVCHAAMRLMTALFASSQMCEVFNGEQLNAMLTALLAIPMADSIPTPNSRKTYALAIFVLQVQRLPVDVLDTAKTRLTFAFRRALDGELGKEGKKGAITDSLKAIGEHLTSDPETFLESFVDIAPSIIQNIMSPNVSVRSQCVNTVGAFVVAMLHVREANPDAARDAFNNLSVLFNEFVQMNSSAVQEASEGKPKAARVNLLSKALTVSMSSDAIENKVTGPIWGACVLANLIVLSGGQIFKRTSSIKLVMHVTPYLTKHKDPLLKAVGRLIWRCLVWAFIDLQQTVDQMDDDSRAKSREISSTTAAWRIVRQVVDGSVGIVTVAAVLRVGFEQGVGRALEVLQRMFESGGSKAHQHATDILHMLTRGVLRREKPTPPFDALSVLVHPALFDGQFMNLGKDEIQTILANVTKASDIRLVRPLTDSEVLAHWETLGTMWRKAFFQTELFPGNMIPSQYLDIWQSLITVKTFSGVGEEASTEPDMMTRKAITNFFKEVLTSDESNLDMTPTQRCCVASQLWDVIRQTFSAHTSKLLALSILPDMSAINICGEDDELVDAWAELMAGLLSKCPLVRMMTWLGSVELDSQAKRRLWLALSRDCNTDPASSYDAAIYLSTAPFTLWSLSPSEWAVWQSVVATAIRRGTADCLLVDTIVDRICDGVDATISDWSILSEICRRLLQTASDDLSAPRTLFGIIFTILDKQYSPECGDVNSVLELLQCVCEWIRVAPSASIIPALDSIHIALATWICDAQGLVDEEQYSDALQPLYCCILDRLTTIPMSLQQLQVFGAFLAAPQVSNKTMMNSLRTFWRSALTSCPSARKQSPPAMRSILRALAVARKEKVSLYFDDASEEVQSNNGSIQEVSADVSHFSPLDDVNQSDASWSIDDDDMDNVSMTSGPRPLTVRNDDNDTFDWVRQVAGPSSELQPLGDALPAAFFSPPQTPPNRTCPSPLGAGDVAFRIDASSSNLMCGTRDIDMRQDYPEPDLESPSDRKASRQILGKRRRNLDPDFNAPVHTVQVSHSRSTSPIEEAESVIEYGMIGKSDERNSVRRVAQGENSDSSISNCDSLPTPPASRPRKKRFLEGVLLPPVPPGVKRQSASSRPILSVLTPHNQPSRPNTVRSSAIPRPTRPAQKSHAAAR